MARMVEIEALKRFVGPARRTMKRGEICVVQENFAAAKVRNKEAIYTAGEPPPTLKNLMLTGPKPVKRPAPKSHPKARDSAVQENVNALQDPEDAEARLKAMDKQQLLDVLGRLGVDGFDKRYGKPRLRAECRKAARAKIKLKDVFRRNAEAVEDYREEAIARNKAHEGQGPDPDDIDSIDLDED